MNRIFKIASIALAGGAALASCQKTPEFITTEVGPDMVINSCTESTYMGADIKFSVDVNDKDFAAGNYDTGFVERAFLSEGPAAGEKSDKSETPAKTAHKSRSKAVK